SGYEVDGAGLAAARPDLLLTQGVCEVCAVPTRDAQAAAAAIACCPTVLALDAHDLAGVLDTIHAVGRVAQVSERADACVRDIEQRLACVRRRGPPRRDAARGGAAGHPCPTRLCGGRHGPLQPPRAARGRRGGAARRVAASGGVPPHLARRPGAPAGALTCHGPRTCWWRGAAGKTARSRCVRSCRMALTS